MPFGLWTWVGPRNRVLDGVQIPHGKGQFLGGKGWPIVKYREYHPIHVWWRCSLLSNYFDNLFYQLLWLACWYGEMSYSYVDDILMGEGFMWHATHSRSLQRSVILVSQFTWHWQRCH